ncbi:MAG TPA: adenylate/guanylate cyclase domain-containing protein, partial [Chthoniobacteraceae bacterium]|nr:adenylate/guanylate cyclase domain-containing protein [Chthoniobacteraceae bacterium]
SGTLDKFIGDAVMAQWGGIVSEGEKVDACRAVAAAVAMRGALSRLNPGWIERGMPEIKFGIGINHGEAIVGNLGAEVKKEVTAIGDAVNTASRLEGMTKEFHVDMLIGEQVAVLVREEFLVRTVALSQPKGKTKPLEIFTVLDRRNGAAEPVWLAAYEDGVRLFRQREFERAAGCFEDALRGAPGDGLASNYLEKCRAFSKEPPPAEWTSVHVMTSK